MPTWVILYACTRTTIPPAEVDDTPAVEIPAVEPPAIGAEADTGRFRPAADTAPEPRPTVTNPIAWGTREPFIRHADGWYYLLETLMNRVELRRASTLAGLAGAERLVIWTPPAGTAHSVGLQGPELHRVGDSWFVYYAATDSALFDLSFNYRLFVLAADGPDPWTATWSFVDELVVAGTDAFSVQPTVLERDGRGWLVWSGNRYFLDFTQHLFIAELVSPTRLGPTRVLLHTPEAAWETRGAAIAESPQVILHDDAALLTWSGGRCDAGPATGVMRLPPGADPMDAGAWERLPSPVLTTDEAAGVYNPGHVAFFSSPDGQEDWVSWDADSAADLDCGSPRVAWAQPLQWGADGLPILSAAPAAGIAIDAPSGEVP